MQTLKDLILAEHSKAQALVIVDIIRQKPELIDDLLAYTFANEEPLSRRAAWPLRIIQDKNPKLLEGKIDLIINQLETIKSIPVLRNIISLLANAKIPENKASFLLDYSAKTILNPNSSIAVIAHSTDLFINMAKGEIILIKELQLMLSQIAQNSRGGIIAKLHHVNKYLKMLQKIAITQ